jgi:hypothetical protein
MSLDYFWQPLLWMEPDSTYHPDAYPGSEFYLMRIRIRLFILMPIRQLSNKGSNPWKSAQIGSYSLRFCLSYKLMRLRIWVRIRILIFIWCGCRSRLAKWCGSGCGTTNFLTTLTVRGVSWCRLFTVEHLCSNIIMWHSGTDFLSSRWGIHRNVAALFFFIYFSLSFYTVIFKPTIL